MTGVVSLLSISGAAEALGMPEQALRLFFTILLGYPIAVVHRNFFYGKPPFLQHAFFAICGLSLGFYNFGYDMMHTIASVLIVYIILKTSGGTAHSVAVTFLLTLGYLLFGYYVTATETYDITWTMPYCILTLRLTGLAFDLYDGTLPEEQLSKDSKKLALKSTPSLLEIAGFSYFPTAFLIGPQFPMRKYQDFIAGKLKPEGQEMPQSVGASIKIFLLGCTYLGLHLFGSSYYSTAYIQSEKYQESPFIQRAFDLGMWAHFALYQYICCWLFTEGACILIGLAYTGNDKEGNAQWNGCSNVDWVLFEKAQNFSHDYISSFNTNTNYWVFQYIYKRLKFLNNKLMSQIGVLLFLSIWHGLHSGYYVCFLMEFISVYMEKEYFDVLQKNEKFLAFMNQPTIYPLKLIFLKFYTLIFMGPCFLPLSFLSWSKYWPVYKAIYCYQILVWACWPLYKPIVLMFLPPARQRTE